MSSSDGCSELSERGGSTLLRVARDSIAHGLDPGGLLRVDPLDFDDELRKRHASFVTLRIAGTLRGCIGSLEAREPLVVDVASNAHRTAFGDPRFSPLTAPELSDLSLHVSVLSPLAAIGATTETELLASLRPGIDGLVLREGGASSTFLPAVWKSLPEPIAFLAELKNKAGLPRDHWSETLRFARYTVVELGGPDEGPTPA